MVRFSGTGVILLLIATELIAVEGAGQAESVTLRIPKVSRPPKLEDFLDMTPREAEAKVSDFRQQGPDDGAPASQETAAYISYDDQNLYVIFVCKDEPSKIRARMTKRDDIRPFSDDMVGVNLDTFHDRQRAYTFVANPLGVQLDGVHNAGRSPDFSFDTLWYSEGRLTPDGFVVWIAIPFKSLRFSSAPVQTWGISFGRGIARNNEFSHWPYITRRIEGFVNQFATLEGLERISPGRNLQFISYGIFNRARFLDPSAPGGPRFLTETEARGGVDAKIVLHDALTLDIAINPDFSQVESDEPQVTVNQRFEVFFPEKRPFFLENAGLFQTDENLFFSRRIANPQLGVRLTGKMGRWAIASLATDDRAPGQRVPNNDPSHGWRAGIGIVRLQREFAKQSNIGLLVTSRDFASSWNRVFSFDTRLKLNQNWILSGQVMRSYTRELEGARFSGPAYLAALQHSGQHFAYTGRYSDRGPGFRSQLGFIPRVDIRQTEHFARYLWRPARRGVVSYGPSTLALVNWNRRGRVQDWVVNSEFGIDLTGLTRFEARRIESFELFQDREFRKQSTTVLFRTEWLMWLAIAAFYSQGTNINFFPASELLPFLANSTEAQFELTWRPRPRLRFNQTYIYSRLSTRRESMLPESAAPTSIFNNYILRSKLNYQFTRELSFRAIFDYNAVLSNPSLVALERTKRLTADFLLTYLVNPGTALYVGYTDGYENLALSPTLPPALRRTVSPSLSTGRQFFVKMSYLLRF